jgi:hypothetical protein
VSAVSEVAAEGGRALSPGTSGAGRTGRTAPAAATWPAPDARRILQLALGAIWLLDAVLQYQPSMFTHAFSHMLAATAPGNPPAVASPITWNARLIEHHGTTLNTAFATVQLLLALGIAWRPTVRPALAASIAWAVGVWWLGEGLGGVLTGNASPVTGAPGAVILYALLAVLLWPADRREVPAPFTAARAVGVPAARAVWFALWASLAYLALLPGNRAPQALHDMIAGMANGEPGWLGTLDTSAAALVAHQGLAASIGLAIVFVLIAAGVHLPVPAARAILVLALVAAVIIWVVGEALGTIFTGGGTDPNSGPLLALLALAYWPTGGLSRAAPGRPLPARAFPGSTRGQ